MGLFSRTNNDSNNDDDFEEIDLPNSQDLKGDVFNSDKSVTPTIAQSRPATPTVKPSGNYTIEDAINLMKTLPKDNNEVVVTVVKKTLESTQIKVTDIVADANQKEARIKNQHKTLENEIKELQDQIAQRNQQISDLLRDLKETTDVRQRLQLAMELDGDNKTADKTSDNEAKQTANSVKPSAENNPAMAPKPAENTSPGNPVSNPTGANASNQAMRHRAQQRANPSSPN